MEMCADPIFTSCCPGNSIGLKALGSDRHLWIGCDGESCSLDSCPGKKFKPQKKEACSGNEFSFHNVDGSKRLLVGNRVVLRTSMNMSLGMGEMFICEGEGADCHSSDTCENDDMFTTDECREQVFIINVPGKNIGDDLYHKDEIILSYEPIDGYKKWITCDLDRSPCAKTKGCRDGNFEVVVSSGGGGDSDDICVTPEQKYEVHKLL